MYNDELQDYEYGGEKIGNQKQYLMLKRLIEAVFNNICMDKITQILEDILGRPFVVVDMGFRIIAKSPTLSAGICSDLNFLNDPYTSLIRTHYLYAKIQERDFVSTVIPCPDCGGLLVASIKISQADAMMLVILLEGHRPDKTELLLVKKISQVLAVEFQKDNLYNQSRLTMPNYMIAQLLSGKGGRRDEFFEQTSHLRWLRAKSFRMLLLGNMGGGTLEKRLSGILHPLKTFLPLDHCMFHEGVLVCYLPERLFLHIVHQEAAAFPEFLTAHHLQGTISECFCDIWDSRRVFLSTQKTQSVAIRFQVPLLLMEDAPMYIVADYIQSNYELWQFCHPAIRTIMEFDLKNKTNLLETLRCYLELRPDIDTAVERLYIHRSTLFYRLKKIKELTGLTLEHVPEVAHLYYSLRLLELCQRELPPSTAGPEA